MTLVDHYDRRTNEILYVIAREASLRAALYLFIAAPGISAEGERKSFRAGRQ
jgi:hypothetical protein